MKRSILFALLAGLSLGAFAQSDPDTVSSSVKISLPPPSIQLPEHPSKIYSGGFETLVGLYDLSNGQTMRLTMQGIHKYAAIGDRPRTEVVSTRDYEFVALNRSLRINLAEPVFGYTTGTVLMAVPNQDLSAAPALQSVGIIAAR
jgi:hypothetical protein